MKPLLLFAALVVTIYAVTVYAMADTSDEYHKHFAKHAALVESVDHLSSNCVIELKIYGERKKDCIRMDKKVDRYAAFFEELKTILEAGAGGILYSNPESERLWDKLKSISKNYRLIDELTE